MRANSSRLNSSLDAYNANTRKRSAEERLGTAKRTKRATVAISYQLARQVANGKYEAWPSADFHMKAFDVNKSVKEVLDHILAEHRSLWHSSQPGKLNLYHNGFFCTGKSISAK